jgi:chromosome segregation ATPase
MAESQRLEIYQLKNMIRDKDNNAESLQNSLEMAQKEIDRTKPLLSELNMLRNENKALQDYLEKNGQASKELERYTSFKKRVYEEGQKLADLKHKYIELSKAEVSHYQNMQATKASYNKTLDNIKDLDQRQTRIQQTSSELTQLQNQRQEIGKLSLKNVFKASERTSLDKDIEHCKNRLENEIDSLQRDYKVTPDKIMQFKMTLLQKSVILGNAMEQQKHTANNLKTGLAQTLDDYKYYNTKISLYSEPYRNIAKEMISPIKAEYAIERALKTITQDDVQRIHDRLPDKMKSSYEDKIQKQNEDRELSKNQSKNLEDRSL